MQVYEFGPFRLDVGEHVLLCNGRFVPLSVKLFELLLLLIENQGRLVTKAELMQKIWPNIAVEESNLPVSIHKLRRVLGENKGKRKFIETVPWRGYRFVHEVKKLRRDDFEESQISSDVARKHIDETDSEKNPEAYNLYLKGQYFLHEKDAQGLKKGAKYFNRAVRLDPAFALAHVGLADSYALLCSYTILPPEESMPKAKAATLRALDLDNTIIEAHASLGLIKLLYDWDWAGAEKELKKAIEVKPNYVKARQCYAIYLSRMGRFDEALKELTRARQLDPLSLTISISIETTLYLARQYDRAIAVCLEILELDPDYLPAQIGLGQAYAQNGMYEKAIRILEKALGREDVPLDCPARLGYVYAISGRKEEAEKMIVRLKEFSKQRYVDPWYIAIIYAGLNESDLAFEWLETAYEIRSVSLVYINFAPELDHLRADPRFAEFSRRIGIDCRASTRLGVISSLAVLPLVNVNDEPDLEYLSEGLTESIISSLSRLPQLRVMAQGTVVRYKSRDVDLQEVGIELSVSAVVTGRVLRSAEKLMIYVELIDIADGSQLWSEQYIKEFSDIILIHKEIAREISEKLRLRLSSKDREQLAKQQTDISQAYECYLKGRYFWNTYTKEGVEKAVEYFKWAIKLDPNYALAYSGLADSYFRQSNVYLHPKETLPKAKAAAIKAVELDDQLAEAHSSLGLLNIYYDHDWHSAEQEYKRAISLNPGYVMAQHRYGAYFMLMARFEKASAQYAQALTLDPLSLQLNLAIGTNFYLLRRIDEAIEQIHKVIELNPYYDPAHLGLGLAYVSKGDLPKALAESRQLMSRYPSLALGVMGYAHAILGRRSNAEKTLKQMIELSARQYASPYWVAIIYAGLGEIDNAFEWLEKTYEDHSDWLVWLKVGPELNNLRSDPRFTDLLKRAGFIQ
jgi:tetratricopeptide (TPR) repeat protein